MLRLILALIVTVASMVFSASSGHISEGTAAGPRQITQDLPSFDSRAIVILWYLDQRQGTRGITKWPRVAFAVGDGTLLLTAAHCVGDFQAHSKTPASIDTVVISPYYGDIFDFEIVAVDKQADLAILKAPWPTHPALSLAGEEELAAARKILIASRPQTKQVGSQLRFELLPVLEVDEHDPNRDLTLKGTRQVARGWSGSPMLIPETGKVAGVLTKLRKASVRRLVFFRSTRFDVMGCRARSIHTLLRKKDLELPALGRPTELKEIADAEDAFSIAIGFLEELLNRNGEESFRAAQEFSRMRPDSVQAHLLLALAAAGRALDPNTLEEKYLELAESSYRKALQIDPNKAHTHAIYGNFLIRTRRADEALAQSEAALAIDPDDRLALMNRLLLLSRNSPDEAKDAALRLLDIYPNDSFCWFYYSNALLDLGQNDKALNAAQRAVDLDPNGLFYGGLADALTRLERLDKAESYYKLMTERCACQQCWYKYAKFLVRNCPKKLDEAEEALEKAEAMSRIRKVSKESLNVLRLQLIEKASPEKAETLVRQLLEAAPDNAAYWWSLAGILRTLGKFDDAVQAAGKAVQLHPDRPYRPRLASCLAKAGDLEEAELTYDEMLALHPDRPKYWFWYARFLGDYFPERIEEARMALEKIKTASDKRWSVKDEELREVSKRIGVNALAPQGP